MTIKSDVKYVMTDKIYNPKSSHNIAAYMNLKKCIGVAGATHGACVKALTYTAQEVADSKKGSALALRKKDHSDFIGYMVRGGHIKVVK